jgi:hypothetical protein
MIQSTWAVKLPAWRGVCRFAQLCFLLMAPAVLADRVTVDPETNLSLDFSIKGATSCILVPDAKYDPQACEGIPRRNLPAPPEGQRSVRALVIVRQSDQVFVLTLTSVRRPGIGEMYDQHIRGFIQATVKQLSQDFSAPVRAVEDAGKPYLLQTVGGVPVVRWAYTTELPETSDQAHTASATVYLIPSQDSLDILSINTHQRNLDAARGVGEQVISTLQVPLTVDARQFGTDMTWALGLQIGAAAVALVLALVLWVWLWRRFKKRHSQP